MSSIRPLFYLKTVVTISLVLVLISCEDDSSGPSAPPSTYDFENVSYSGQTTRQDMLAELVTYMKTANTPLTKLDATIMGNMYANSNSPFAVAELNDSDKNLRSKTYQLDVSDFEQLILDYAASTQAVTIEEAQPGQAGVMYSNDRSKQYFVNEKGKEYTQLIEKGLMGAVFYSQITSVYLTDSKIGDAIDNETVEPGKGTPMQHHWDEAFGYLGLPENYPGDTENVRFLGKYINARESVLGSGTKIMNAIIAGRHAINEGDMEEKSAQASIVIAELEKAMGGTAINYINSALSNITDAALRNHALSEAEAFIQSLKYNDSKTISEAKVQEALDALGDDFNEVSDTDLKTARDIIAVELLLTDMVDSL